MWEEYEERIRGLEDRLEELKHAAEVGGVDLGNEISLIETRLGEAAREISEKLTPSDRVSLARHPQRPRAIDFLRRIARDFLELHGDRSFGDDPAILAGLATIAGREVLLLAQEKGADAREKAHRNFGMANPEGYRKGIRLMHLAERMKRPVVAWIDTPGAYPGMGAEERGQAHAIAESLAVMSRLEVPTVSAVLGEGGSGGALAFAVADRVLIFENAIYSVISPEGCAAILFHDATRAGEAAAALKMTAKDLLGLGIVDEVLPEPPGGMHRNTDRAARTLEEAIGRHLGDLEKMAPEARRQARYEKFRRMGVFLETE